MGGRGAQLNFGALDAQLLIKSTSFLNYVDQVASICKSIASERVSGSFFVCFSFCFGLFHSVCHLSVCLCVSVCVCVNMKDVWEIPAECQVKCNIGSDLLHCVTSA